MSTLMEIAEAMSAKITEQTGLRGVSWVADNVNPPMFMLAPGDITRGAMVMGQMEFTVYVTVLTSRIDDKAGQFKLFEYVDFTSDKSVWQALEAADPLGLGDTDAKVMRYRPLGAEELAAYNYFGGTFEVAVVTEGA